MILSNLPFEIKKNFAVIDVEKSVTERCPLETDGHNHEIRR